MTCYEEHINTSVGCIMCDRSTKRVVFPKVWRIQGWQRARALGTKCLLFFSLNISRSFDCAICSQSPIEHRCNPRAPFKIKIISAQCPQKKRLGYQIWYWYLKPMTTTSSIHQSRTTDCSRVFLLLRFRKELPRHQCHRYTRNHLFQMERSIRDL